MLTLGFELRWWVKGGKWDLRFETFPESYVRAKFRLLETNPTGRIAAPEVGS